MEPVAHYPVISTNSYAPLTHAPQPQASAEIEKSQTPTTFKSLFQRFLNLFKRSAEDDVEIEQELLHEVDPYNPEREPAPREVVIRQMIGQKSSVRQLQEMGFSPEQMQEDSIYLVSLRDSGYDLRELNQLLPKWETLRELNFNKTLFNGFWHVDLLCSVYSLNKTNVCQQLDFRVEDFLKARTTPDEFRKLGVSANELLELGLNFETLFAFHLDIAQLNQFFGFTKDHLIEMKLNKSQMLALEATRGFTASNIVKILGAKEYEIEDMGVKNTMKITRNKLRNILMNK